MERNALQSLREWKHSPYRKPLFLKGARQVGKTWLLKEFGKREYKNVCYINFDEELELAEFFRATKKIEWLLPNLAIAKQQKIVPGETLLILDEIQNAPEALNSLKYFKENAPEYHVACAGSLLGVALARPSSFPVGQVDFITIYPMTFLEFLRALGMESYADYLETQELEEIPTPFFTPLVEKLKTYLVTGGMPEVVKQWIQTQSPAQIQTTLLNILTAYERDFAKHPDTKEYPKISLVWQSLPSQLARENKKFLYSAVKEGARAREYEDALQWLSHSQVVYKIYRSKAPGLPLSAYDDLSAFKIYLSDVGLLRRLSGLEPSVFAEGERLFTEFKGALTENFVLQSLLPQFDRLPRYWARNNPSYEVDFLIQWKNEIIPMEVKAGTNVESRNLKKYEEQYPKETKLKVRFSLNNLRLDGNLLNIPLFMADQASRLIQLGMDAMKTPTSL